MQAYGNMFRHIETTLYSEWILCADVSEHSVSAIFIDGVSLRH